MNLKKQAGFSLIELMIVVTILGILAALAIPSYQNYTQRARFAEVIAATAPFKTAVTLALHKGAPLNELNNGVHGIPASPAATKNLAHVTVEHGTITATSTESLSSVTYVLKPSAKGDTWAIEGTCLKDALCDS